VSEHEYLFGSNKSNKTKTIDVQSNMDFPSLADEQVKNNTQASTTTTKKPNAKTF
jgi:hypothetical protein